MLSKLSLVIFITTLTACATISQDRNPELLYRKDMEIKINGKRRTGVIVTSASNGNLFEIEGRYYASAEILKLTTCHREKVWTKAGKSFKYDFTPNMAIEGTGLCLMEIGAFDEKGQHSWGLVDFKNDDESLPGTITCNGENFVEIGVSICQSKAGLMQAIKFNQPVKVYAPEGCEKPETEDEKTFLYTIQRGKCVFLFASDTEHHRHTTFGYDDVLIRGY